MPSFVVVLHHNLSPQGRRAAAQIPLPCFLIKSINTSAEIE
jgi:hypothetical protein